MKLDVWQKLSGRLQSAAYRGCKGHHYSEMTVRLIFLDGELYGWSNPTLGIDYVEAPAVNCETLADARLRVGNGELADEARSP